MNAAQSTFDLLSRTRFAEGLDPGIVRVLAGTARTVEVKAGTVLFEEGSRQESIFIVVSGHVAIDMQVPRRGRVRLLTVGPGELVGWSGLIGEGVMTATATATEDSVLVSLSTPRILEIGRNDHEFGYVLMTRAASTISSRLLATRLQLLDLFSDTEAADTTDS